MNGAGLLELGFELGDHLGGATEGAWRAIAQDGTQVVLKWSPDRVMVDHYAALLPGLATLRRRGVPVPTYLNVIPFDGGTLSSQRFLPGRPQDNPSQAVVDAIFEHMMAKAGVGGPDPAYGGTWGAFVVETLQVGQDRWCAHDPVGSWTARSANLLDRIEALGADADPGMFPNDGLVHLDLHTNNLLIDGETITGIIDWEGACTGDHRYDLVQFAFDLDGHDQPIWDVVDQVGFRPQVIRAYVALLVLKCMSAAILYRPWDMARQFERAERVFERYKI